MSVVLFFLWVPLLGLILMLILGPIPGRVAKNRNHPNAQAIKKCGYFAVFGGLRMWLAVLFWAYAGGEPPEKIRSKFKL